jgi:hypothetical protein
MKMAEGRGRAITSMSRLEKVLEKTRLYVVYH